MIVDGESCEELHQTEPGDVTIETGAGSRFGSTDTLARPERLRRVAPILLVLGLLLVIAGSALFASSVAERMSDNAVLESRSDKAGEQVEQGGGGGLGLVLVFVGVVPLMLGISGFALGGAAERKNVLTVYDGWARAKNYRKRAPIWVGLGAVMVLGGGVMFAVEVSAVMKAAEERKAALEAGGRGDMQAYKALEQEGTGGLGLGILLLGLIPLVAGGIGLSEPAPREPKRAPKGGHAPRHHKLFEWVASEGTYYINVPPEAKGKLALAGSKATVEQLRQRFGEQGNMRLKLGSKARGKLLIGQTRVLFQTAAPAEQVVKPPFPTEFVDPFYYLRPGSLEIVTVGGALGLAILLGLWFYYGADRTPPPPAERFTNVMGTTVLYEEEEEEPIPEEEVEEEVLKQEDKDKAKDEKEEEIDESKLVKPSNVSDKAFQQARGVGVARVLGTYGGPGEGTVLDVIESTENSLGDLFAQGMAIGEYKGGALSGNYVAGGGGINATGTVAGNEGLVTGEGPAEVGKTDKKERKVASKVDSQTNEVFGDIDKQSISGTIRRKMSGLQACYNKALISRPELKGKIEYTISINVQGRVTKVDIEEDTVGDASVKTCTIAKIKDWRFIADGAEEGSEVTFSVSFTGA